MWRNTLLSRIGRYRIHTFFSWTDRRKSHNSITWTDFSPLKIHIPTARKVKSTSISSTWSNKPVCWLVYFCKFFSLLFFFCLIASKSDAGDKWHTVRAACCRANVRKSFLKCKPSRSCFPFSHKSHNAVNFLFYQVLSSIHFEQWPISELCLLSILSID